MPWPNARWLRAVLANRQVDRARIGEPPPLVVGRPDQQRHHRRRGGSVTPPISTSSAAKRRRARWPPASPTAGTPRPPARATRRPGGWPTSRSRSVGSTQQRVDGVGDEVRRRLVPGDEQQHRPSRRPRRRRAGRPESDASTRPETSASSGVVRLAATSSRQVGRRARSWPRCFAAVGALVDHRRWTSAPKASRSASGTPEQLADHRHRQRHGVGGDEVDRRGGGRARSSSAAAMASIPADAAPRSGAP